MLREDQKCIKYDYYLKLFHVLAASWDHRGVLGGLLSPSWARLGGRNRNQKPAQKSIRTLMHLGIDFLNDLGGFYVPKWSQLASENLLEIDVNLEMLFFQKNLVFFHRKNIDFGGCVLECFKSRVLMVFTIFTKSGSGGQLYF